jgi:histidyl-tRNA synthetase
MRDIVGEECRIMRLITDECAATARVFGCTEIITPIAESADVFLRTLGEGSDVVMKEMYSFEDRSGNVLCLRPEATAGVMRALIQSGHAREGVPKRLYYSGPMFRYERPQRGRYRQFWQFGVEFVGEAGADADAEAIAMGHSILESLRLSGACQLLINSLGDAESRSAYKAVLTSFLEPLLPQLSADSQARFERGSVLRILDSKDESDRLLLAGAPSIVDWLSTRSKQRFDAVRQRLDALGIGYPTPFHSHPRARGRARTATPT